MLSGLFFLPSNDKIILGKEFEKIIYNSLCENPIDLLQSKKITTSISERSRIYFLTRALAFSFTRNFTIFLMSSNGSGFSIGN